MNFEKDITIAGVIFNKVARSRHEAMLRSSVEKYCNIPVLGAIPKNVFSLFPERHLGLVPVAEYESVDKAVAENIAIVEQHIDIEGICAVAKSASPLGTGGRKVPAPRVSDVKIGIIHDRSFTFYYPENIEALAEAGAELVYINSLQDEVLPTIDGLYIGGGFPEVFGAAITANVKLRADIKTASDNGMPIYAECGGLMYLSRTVVWQGKEFAMCGVLPLDVVVEGTPQGHGYTLMRSTASNPFFPAGACVKGHEFHHSRVINIGEGAKYAYEVIRGQGIDGKHDGIVYRNTFATYNHIHAEANPEWAQRFVALAKDYEKTRSGY